MYMYSRWNSKVTYPIDHVLYDTVNQSPLRLPKLAYLLTCLLACLSLPIHNLTELLSCLLVFLAHDDVEGSFVKTRQSLKILKTSSYCINCLYRTSLILFQSIIKQTFQKSYEFQRYK